MKIYTFKKCVCLFGSFYYSKSTWASVCVSVFLRVCKWSHNLEIDLQTETYSCNYIDKLILRLNIIYVNAHTNTHRHTYFCIHRYIYIYIYIYACVFVYVCVLKTFGNGFRETHFILHTFLLYWKFLFIFFPFKYIHQCFV